MEEDENIELVSLSHFRGRTFDDAIVIIDEFQNLTRSQFAMALGRLGKNSIMILCGDNQQIDLKDKNYSAIHEVAKITNSQYVYKTVLKDNHRHEAIFEVLQLLNNN
jgi:phosphate starvation-inducible protein PhoH